MVEHNIFRRYHNWPNFNKLSIQDESNKWVSNPPNKAVNIDFYIMAIRVAVKHPRNI